VDNAQFQSRMQRIEELIASVEEHGLSRMLQLVDAQIDTARFHHDQFVRDELISRLLLLHGLHPIALETRVRQALEHVRPLLELKGSSARLLEATHDVIRLQLGDCPENVRAIVEQALLEAAPDVLKIEFTDAGEGSRRIPLALV
jgi:hypothetical protein